MTGVEGCFTLIEALVALSLGVAAVVVLSTLHIASNGATRAAATATEVEGFAGAGALMAGDAAHGLLLRDADGALVFKGQPHSVRFPALARFSNQRVDLRYDLMPSHGATSVLRAEAPLLGGGGPDPFGATQAVWQGPGVWELRYLDAKGAWLRDWTGPDLPRAFGLVAVTAPITVELVAAFPGHVEPDCALGPGPACSLAAGVFP